MRFEFEAALKLHSFNANKKREAREGPLIHRSFQRNLFIKILSRQTRSPKKLGFTTVPRVSCRLIVESPARAEMGEAPSIFETLEL